MNAIRINVNKQMDGYSFSITPSTREAIRKQFSNAYPANSIFVGYDTRSDFESHIDKLERYIYPALLGVDNANDLKLLDEVQFVDSQTDKVLRVITHYKACSSNL